MATASTSRYEPSEAPRPLVLVVDDAALDRRLAGGLVERAAGAQVVYAENGVQALELIKKFSPALVLTDMQMPQMNGLELVQHMREQYPLIPAVLMTGNGSEELAIAALRQGAVSYVPKGRLAADLSRIMRQGLDAAELNRDHFTLLQCMISSEVRFAIPNEPGLISPLAQRMQNALAEIQFCSKTVRVRVYIALEEALRNAMYHGNLEVSSAGRDDTAHYLTLIEQRRHQSPYADRLIDFHACINEKEAWFRVRDKGPGFDPNTIPDPTDPANLESDSGRGLLLIQTFMDEVIFNDACNEITMIKRRTSRTAAD